MTGRGYMGEMLIEVWLKYIRVIGEQSECIKREFEKILPGFMQVPEKCAMKMKVE